MNFNRLLKWMTQDNFNTKNTFYWIKHYKNRIKPKPLTLLTSYKEDSWLNHRAITNKHPIYWGNIVEVHINQLHWKNQINAVLRNIITSDRYLLGQTVTVKTIMMIKDKDIDQFIIYLGYIYIIK